MGEESQTRTVRIDYGDVTATAIGEATRSAVVVRDENDPTVARAAASSSSGKNEHDQTAKHNKEYPT
jgi:hypothetical protein